MKVSLLDEEYVPQNKQLPVEHFVKYTGMYSEAPFSNFTSIA